MSLSHRYDGNMPSFTHEECAVLETKHVTIAGCGSIGGFALESLARIGVGTLRVIDGGTFEENDLNSQFLCTESTLGKQKAPVAAERIVSVNSSIQVEPVVASFGERNARDLLKGTDCVLDCLDDPASRFWLAYTCQHAGIPVVYGAVAGWFGQVCTVFPGDITFVSIYGEPFEESRHEPLGNLPFTAGAVASIQAAEAAKVLLDRPGIIRNRLLMIDLLGGSADNVDLR